MAHKDERDSNRKLLNSWILGRRKHRHTNKILIAHLGNLDGRDEEQENTPAYIQSALKQGYAVCCEVVYVHGAFVLPTKAGCKPLPSSLLSNQEVWFRANDAATIDALCGVNAHVIPGGAQIALTSVHYLWCMPGADLTPRSIAVYPEHANPGWLEAGEPAGLCSNEISRYL